MERSRLRHARPTRCTTLLALLGVLYGCAGDGPPPAGTADQLTQIQNTIFNQYCLSAGCHNAQAQAGTLDLSSATTSYAELVGVPPDNVVARDQGLLRVEPFDSANSFLIVKLTGPGVGQGSPMPMGMDPLSQAEIDQIVDWIQAGAQGVGTQAPTGSQTPASPTPTDTSPPTPTPTDTLPPTPTATVPAPATPTATETPIPLDTGTATPTVTGSAPPTSTATATATVTPTVTATDSPSPSPSPSVTATPGVFSVIQATIFNTTCTNQFCHDVEAASGGLILVEGQSYAELVGVIPDNAAARAAGMLRVDAGDPDNSFLLVKLTNPTPAEGLRMPLGMEPLSAEQILLIREWIAAGAAP